MNQVLKNQLQWIDQRLNALMDEEYPHPESIDYLWAERDRVTAQCLKEDFNKIDWEAHQKS